MIRKNVLEIISWVIIIFFILIIFFDSSYFTPTQVIVIDENGNPIFNASVDINYFCSGFSIFNVAGASVPGTTFGEKNRFTNSEGIVSTSKVNNYFSFVFYEYNCRKGIRVSKEGYCGDPRKFCSFGDLFSPLTKEVLVTLNKVEDSETESKEGSQMRHYDTNEECMDNYYLNLSSRDINVLINCFSEVSYKNKNISLCSKIDNLYPIYYKKLNIVTEYSKIDIDKFKMKCNNNVAVLMGEPSLCIRDDSSKMGCIYYATIKSNDLNNCDLITNDYVKSRCQVAIG